MSKLLQLRGGTTTEHASFTGAVREVTVDTTKDTLVVHDGATAGGFPLPTTAAEIVALISNDAIDTEHLAADSVTTAKIADSVALGGSPTTTTQTASDNSTKIATTAYTDVAIAALADSAPATLNTLNELAAALGDDANYATTTATAIGLKAPLASPTFTGTVAMPADSIAEATLHVSNAGTNGQYLQKQSGNAGGLTWGTVDTTTLLPKAGGTMTGDVTFADNIYAKFGTGNDLRIRHDGSNSYISETGTGNLIIQTNGADFLVENTDGDNMINAISDGAVELSHNNAVKLATTSAGVSITGALVASGNITAFSDERLKSHIQTIPNALDKVLSVRGVTYDMNDERGTGVIAQELEKVLPEAVFDNEDGMKSVAYGNVVGMLIEAIKEQQAQIDNLMEIVGGS
jgi:hypothetical protein